MELKFYFYKKNVKIKDLAKTIGMSREALSLILNGHRKPRKSTIDKIVKATNGLVTEASIKKSFHENQRKMILQAEKKKKILSKQRTETLDLFEMK